MQWYKVLVWFCTDHLLFCSRNLLQAAIKARETKWWETSNFLKLQNGHPQFRHKLRCATPGFPTGPITIDPIGHLESSRYRREASTCFPFSSIVDQFNFPLEIDDETHANGTKGLGLLQFEKHFVTQFSGENPQNGTIESLTSIPHRFFGDIMLHSADVSELDDGPPQIWLPRTQHFGWRMAGTVLRA